MRFTTSIKYDSRESKSEYVFDKYQGLFEETVLDVGADAMYLKNKIISNGGNYLGVGYGDGIDIELNLEKAPLPFKDNEFDTVICLDVLEHLENIHAVFDELCRVSKKSIIISLPNPWSDLFTTLRIGNHSEEEGVKFYGLPPEKPLDRHRWFFSEKEAYNFVSYRSKKNGWNLTQFDSQGDQKKMGGNGLKGLIGRSLLKSIFRSDIDKLGLHHSTLWFTLEKNE
jgi:SAM-dependent methyltransferase